MSNSNSSKQILLSVIGIAILVIAVVGVAFAFFNYTRTGASNTIKVGRISFNSEQNGVLNMTNVFPVKSTELDASTLDYITIGIQGDTTYLDGEEFEITLTGINNTINNKEIPINYIASYEANGSNDIGESSNNYFSARESKDASVYTLRETGMVKDGEQVLIGYIDNGTQGINGTLTIKAYIDADRIAISDTYPEETKRTVRTNGYSSSNCETVLSGVDNSSTYCASIVALQDAIDNENLTSAQITLLVNAGIVEEYTNGTSSEWIDGRVVFTTEEWNSLQNTMTPISFKIKAESNEGIWVEEPVNVMVGSMYNTPFYDKQNIKEVYFIRDSEENISARYDAATIKGDLTSNNEGSVKGWIDGDKLYIASDGKTYLQDGLEFRNISNNIEQISFQNIDTSRMTSMNGLFRNIKVSTVDLSSFDTSNVTNFQYMFSDNYYLTSVDLSEKNLEAVKQMNYMFRNCSSLEEVDFSNTSTPSLEYINYMFAGCSKIESIDLTNLGSDLLNTMNLMFSGCTNLKNVNMSNFNFGTASLSSLFKNLKNLESINLTNVNMQNVYDMGSMFSGCSKLSSIDLSGLGSNNLNYISSIFEDCTMLNNVKMRNFNFGSASLDELFAGLTNLESVDLTNANTQNVTDMSDMFSGCSKLSSIDLSGLGSDNLNYISSIFKNCTMLNNVNMSNFNFGTASLYSLFYNLSNLENVNLSGANTANVTNMSYMFYGCEHLYNLNLNNINTSSVANFGSMFYGCSSLINLDLHSFDMSSATSFNSIFYGCTNLETIDLSGVTTFGTQIYNMFSNLSSLTTIYVGSNWDSSNQQTNMPVFTGCTSLVGGNGTTYSSDKDTSNYAVVDTPSTPGYLTLKEN